MKNRSGRSSALLCRPSTAARVWRKRSSKEPSPTPGNKAPRWWRPIRSTNRLVPRPNTCGSGQSPCTTTRVSRKWRVASRIGPSSASNLCEALDAASLSFSDFMKPIDGYFVIKPEDLFWRPSNLMKIPNADFLERTKSEILGARLWRLPPKSANTLHRHPKMEEFYFVVEGVGRIRVEDKTLTVPKHGGVLVGPDLLRQVFNDTDEQVLWLIVGAPEEMEFLQGSKSKMDLSVFYP